MSICEDHANRYSVVAAAFAPGRRKFERWLGSIIIRYPRMVFDMKFEIYANNASMASTLFYSAIMSCSRFVIQARPIQDVQYIVIVQIYLTS
jgi:hypothetical protein